MQHDNRRITLVSRSRSAPQRLWLTAPDAPRRLIFVGSFGVIPYALQRGVEELGKDIETVIIDGAANAAEYLHLLSRLPASYAGDVVLIQDDSAFVSATGRGGDRVLYALGPDDVQFYLEAKLLTSPPHSAAA
ncbi:MAG TPA: hypothetical protein VJZ76_06540 [Thermoanaerobaculia bacterium]|nr:hypothetical protein [Thermoanaerobaculia bacterium]